jgi:hypothetical protein
MSCRISISECWLAKRADASARYLAGVCHLSGSSHNFRTLL